MNSQPSQAAAINKICHSCGAAAPDAAYFCPNCGKPLGEKPPAVSVSRQIAVYLISFLLPPLGYWYGWKYLKQKDAVSKKIGWAAVIITSISIVIAIWATLALVDSVNQSINQLNSAGF